MIALTITYGAICVTAIVLFTYRIIKNPDKEVFTYKKVLR